MTGHNFADYLIGEVLTPTRARTFSNGLLRATPFALYLEDTWKATPKLTLSLGVRFENTPPTTTSTVAGSTSSSTKPVSALIGSYIPIRRFRP